LTRCRSFYTHAVVGFETGASQWRTQPSTATTSATSPLCSLPLAVDTTAVTHLAPTPASPIEHYENEIEGENRDSTKNGHLCVISALSLLFLYSLECCYYSDDVHEIVFPTLAMARPPTMESGPPMNPVATAKPPPPVPPRIVGSKRKFVDQGIQYNSINPARKVSKLP